MTKYLAPDLGSLTESIRQITETYKEPDNIHRTQQLELLQSLLTNIPAEENRHEIMLGSLIFVRDSIQAEYDQYYLSRFSYFYAPTGSRLFLLAETALAMDGKNNTLDDQSRFIYLSTFFNYLEKNKHGFSAAAEAMTKQARNNLNGKIKQLCFREPTVGAFRNNFRQLPGKYQEHCANDSAVYRILSYLGIGGRSARRQEALRCIEILDKRCRALEANAEEKEGDDEPRDYFLRRAFLLKTMQEIENEYSFRSPENSYLYREIKRITNIEHSSKLSNNLKEADFAKLYTLICDDLNSKEKMEFWKKCDVNYKDLRKIKNDIINLLKELNEPKDVMLTSNKTLNTLINKFMDRITVTIAQSGVIFAIVEMANFLASSGISLNVMLTIATPQNAAIIMGSVWVLNQCRSSANSFLTGMCIPVIAPLVQAPLKMFSKKPPSFEKNPTLDDNDRALIKALHNASDTIFSAQEKLQLAMLFNLDKPESVPVHLRSIANGLNG